MTSTDPQLRVSAPVLGSNNQTFDDALAVRKLVFVEEQHVPLENEVDEQEPRSWHWVAYSGSAPVGTVRMVPPPHAHAAEGPDPDKEPSGNYAKVGRLATVKEARGKGVARLLVEAAMRFAAENWAEMGCRDGGGERAGGEWDGRVLAHAQVDVKKAWERMGFEVDEGIGEWVEEGIMHCGMWRIAKS